MDCCTPRACLSGDGVLLQLCRELAVPLEILLVIPLLCHPAWLGLLPIFGHHVHGFLTFLMGHVSRGFFVLLD